MLVVADPEAVSFIAAHGGRLYVCGDASGPKCVKAEPPDDPSVRFEQVAAAGFLMYVEAGIAPPERWTVTFRRVPHDRVEVLWDGRQYILLRGEPFAWWKGTSGNPVPTRRRSTPSSSVSGL
jgi:hypothetical protein